MDYNYKTMRLILMVMLKIQEVLIFQNLFELNGIVIRLITSLKYIMLIYKKNQITNQVYSKWSKLFIRKQSVAIELLVNSV
jgi:hypothetical protein